MQDLIDFYNKIFFRSWEIEKHFLELKDKLSNYDLTESNDLISDLFNNSDEEIKKWVSSFTACTEGWHLKVILLLDQLGYTLSDKDIKAIENPHASGSYKIYNVSESSNPKEIHRNIKILLLYYKRYKKTGKYCMLHRGDASGCVDIYLEDEFDGVLNGLTIAIRNNPIVLSEEETLSLPLTSINYAVKFYKECYLRTRDDVLKTLLLQLPNGGGWFPKPVREIFQLLIPLYGINSPSSFEGIHKYVTKDGLRNFLGVFADNLLQNNTRNLSVFRDKVINNQPLPLIIWIKKHAVGVLIYQSYIVYLNTGNRSEGLASGATYYLATNMRDFLEKELPRFCGIFNEVKQVEDLFSNLVTSGNIKKVYFQLMPEQISGDCSVRAINYLIPVAITLELYNKQSLLLRKALEIKFFIKNVISRGSYLPTRYEWVDDLIKAGDYIKSKKDKPVESMDENERTNLSIAILHIEALSSLLKDSCYCNSTCYALNKFSKIAWLAWEKMYENTTKMFLEDKKAHLELREEQILLENLKKKSLKKLISDTVTQKKFSPYWQSKGTVTTWPGVGLHINLIDKRQMRPLLLQ